MGRYIQKENGKGSLHNIQLLVNDFHDIFLRHIQCENPSIKSIQWVSPLKEHGMAEYRDNCFIKIVKIENRVTIPLHDFWPRMGPQWDALGIANSEIVLLVEAKANLLELVSPGTRATENSLYLIEKSLNQVKEYLECSSEFIWSDSYYQYTNRIAHLYYLRVLNKIPAYLINVHFIGDKSVKGPLTRDEWINALKVMKQYLGINNEHTLNDYIVDLFVHVNEIGKSF